MPRYPEPGQNAIRPPRGRQALQMIEELAFHARC